MAWWGWMIVGVALLGTELLFIDAQFFLVFLGLAAVVVGLAALFGLGGPEWVQWILFGILALIFMFGFRGRLYSKLRGNPPGFDDSLAGQTFTLDKGLDAGAEGRAPYRGTTWRVLNAGPAAIQPGTRVRIVDADGLILKVEAAE